MSVPNFIDTSINSKFSFQLIAKDKVTTRTKLMGDLICFSTTFLMSGGCTGSFHLVSQNDHYKEFLLQLKRFSLSSVSRVSVGLNIQGRNYVYVLTDMFVTENP